jgi:hypothetical protein
VRARPAPGPPPGRASHHQQLGPTRATVQRLHGVPVDDLDVHGHLGADEPPRGEIVPARPGRLPRLTLRIQCLHHPQRHAVLGGRLERRPDHLRAGPRREREHDARVAGRQRVIRHGHDRLGDRLDDGEELRERLRDHEQARSGHGAHQVPGHGTGVGRPQRIDHSGEQVPQRAPEETDGPGRVFLLLPLPRVHEHLDAASGAGRVAGRPTQRVPPAAIGGGEHPDAPRPLRTDPVPGSRTDSTRRRGAGVPSGRPTGLLSVGHRVEPGGAPP